MVWINVNDRLPTPEQEVYYFSPILGLWRGKYIYSPPDYSVWYDDDGKEHREPMSDRLKSIISPHVFVGGGGCCDTDEVTHWQPYDADAVAKGWVPLPPMYGPPHMSDLRQFRPDLPDSPVRTAAPPT